MRITMVTGGARSGKSSFAASRASALGARRVSYVATAHVEDDEMARRVARHRSERPAGWQTLEAAADAGRAVAGAKYDVVVLDCLTLLLTNAILRPRVESSVRASDLEERIVEARAEGAVSRLLAAARSREGELLVVTNEVGMGIVPAHPLGRWFRDAQGRANRRVAAVASSVVLMVSGIPCHLRGGAVRPP